MNWNIIVTVLGCSGFWVGSEDGSEATNLGSFSVFQPSVTFRDLLIDPLPSPMCRVFPFLASSFLIIQTFTDVVVASVTCSPGQGLIFNG